MKSFISNEEKWDDQGFFFHLLLGESGFLCSIDRAFYIPVHEPNPNQTSINQVLTRVLKPKTLSLPDPGN